MVHSFTCDKRVGLRHGVGPSYALLHHSAGHEELAWASTQVVKPARNAGGLAWTPHFRSAERGPILDVETHRASSDEVVADIYEQWLHRPG